MVTPACRLGLVWYTQTCDCNTAACDGAIYIGLVHFTVGFPLHILTIGFSFVLDSLSLVLLVLSQGLPSTEWLRKPFAAWKDDSQGFR